MNGTDWVRTRNFRRDREVHYPIELRSQRVQVQSGARRMEADLCRLCDQESINLCPACRQLAGGGLVILLRMDRFE